MINQEVPPVPRLLAAVLFVCATSPGVANDSIVAEHENEFVEPIVTEETLPDEVGEWELQVRTHFVRKGDETTAILPGLSLSSGLTPRLGGEISIPLVYRDDDGVDSYDLGPVSAGLKLLIVEPELHRTAVVLGLELEFPTGDEVEFPSADADADAEDPERSYEIEASVGFLRTVGDATLQGNAGWSIGVPRSEGSTSHSATYNWAASFPVGRAQTNVMVELNGAIGVRNAEDTAAFAPGIRHSWDDSLSFAVAIPIGLNDNTPEWALLLDWQMEF